jgi:YesN/AraC family two-component response regulator
MQNLITAIIVDDEQDAIDNIERMISNEILEINIVSTTKSAQSALEIITNHLLRKLKV